MSATIQPGLATPNLFAGGFGLSMPQTRGIPNFQGGQPAIKLEAPGLAGGYGEMGGVGGFGQDVDGGAGFGMQPMAFDMGANFVFYPEGNEPLAVEQSNDSEQACTAEAAVDQSKEEDAPVKTRDAAISKPKKAKKGGLCC